MHGFAYIVWNIFTTNFGRHAVVHFNPLQSQQCSFSSGVHCLITVEGVLSEDVIWGLVHTWGLQFRFWLEKLGSSPNNFGYPFIAPKCRTPRSTACIPRVDTCIYSTRGALQHEHGTNRFQDLPRLAIWRVALYQRISSRAKGGTGPLWVPGPLWQLLWSPRILKWTSLVCHSLDPQATVLIPSIAQPDILQCSWLHLSTSRRQSSWSSWHWQNKCIYIYIHITLLTEHVHKYTCTNIIYIYHTGTCELGGLVALFPLTPTSWSVPWAQMEWKGGDGWCYLERKPLASRGWKTDDQPLDLVCFPASIQTNPLLREKNTWHVKFQATVEMKIPVMKSRKQSQTKAGGLWCFGVLQISWTSTRFWI